MKKLLVKTIIVCFFLGLIVSFGCFIGNTLIVKSYRYVTPEEAFYQSMPNDAILIDVLTNQEVALVIYSSSSGTMSDHLLVKDSKGWTSLYVKQSYKTVPLANGIFYIYELGDKAVVAYCIIEDAGKDPPNITDSYNTKFEVNTHVLDSGRMYYYGFSVLQNGMTAMYSINIDGESIFGAQGTIQCDTTNIPES